MTRLMRDAVMTALCADLRQGQQRRAVGLSRRVPMYNQRIALQTGRE